MISRRIPYPADEVNRTMTLINKICIVGILILALSCSVEEYASYRFRYDSMKSPFRMTVFLAIAVMAGILFVTHFMIH